MILDTVNGQDLPRYLIYDIIMFAVSMTSLLLGSSIFTFYWFCFQGQPVGDCDFLTRLTCIKKEIIGPRHEKMRQGLLDRAKQAFSVRIKEFWDISQSKELLDGR